MFLDVFGQDSGSSELGEKFRIQPDSTKSREPCMEVDGYYLFVLQKSFEVLTTTNLTRTRVLPDSSRDLL